jgi:hypothetical protein
MNFNKKLFYRALMAFAVLDLCILLSGCGDWESQASSILSLLGPAITAALQILTAFGIGISPTVITAFNSWEQQAQTALTTIKSLIAGYKAALPAAQPGILVEIQTAISTVASNLTTVLGELHVTNPGTQAKIAAVFAAISWMFAAIVSLIPAIQGKVADHHEQARLYVAYQDKAKNFKADFNKAAGAFGAKYELK